MPSNIHWELREQFVTQWLHRISFVRFPEEGNSNFPASQRLKYLLDTLLLFDAFFARCGFDFRKRSWNVSTLQSFKKTRGGSFMPADSADKWIEKEGLRSYLEKRKEATEAVAQILPQWIGILQTTVLEEGQARRVPPGLVNFQPGQPGPPAPALGVAGPAAWQGQIDQAMYVALQDQPWGLQMRAAGLCLQELARARYKDHDSIVLYITECLRRLKPYMVLWGNIGPRQYTFEVVEEMVNQGFFAADYIALMCKDGQDADFRRKGNWGIHAVFVQFPEFRRELEDGPIWDELNWYPVFMETFREIISSLFNELTLNNQQEWSYNQLSVSMENRAREAGWRRLLFPAQVLIDQYALNKSFYDAVGQLPPARENPIKEGFKPHFPITEL